MCGFNDAYIVVTCRIDAVNSNLTDYDDISDNIENHKKVGLKNSALFCNCPLKINNELIHNAQDLDIVNPMYNLLYHSKSFRKTTGSVWNYYPDKANSGYSAKPDDQGDDVYEKTKLFYSIKNSESLHYKNMFIGNLPDDNNAVLEDIKIVVPLKNLSNLIFSLDFLMKNTEIELILRRSQNCVLCEKTARTFKRQIEDQDGNVVQNQANGVNTPASLKFNITDCKLYVSVVTLQGRYDNKLLEKLKTGIDI